MRAIFLVLTLVTVLAGGAAGAEPSAPSKEAGKGLVIAGSVVQVVGVGFGIANLLGRPGPRSWPYNLASIPFAPLTVAGYELLLSDGTRRGQRLARSRGLLEGAAYAGVIGALSGLAIPVHDAWCDTTAAKMEAAGMESWGPCFEDMSFLVFTLTMIPHLAAATGMLIGGLGSLDAARKAGAGEVRTTRLWIAPYATSNQAGVVIRW